ncbi:MAG: NAD-dependent epimerase/dehydratase family protein [Gemmataceae bacterium]|nr:NAD-dependent epimerase/dehydratase family protein [Gemmataceae bacterium]
MNPTPPFLHPGDLVLVTGGAGFIGSHLVERLLADEVRVRVLEKPGAENLPIAKKVDLILGDICDSACVERAVQGCRAVFHLAADPNLWRKSRSGYHQVNYLGAKNVIELALKQGVPRIVHTSTESILTRKDQTGPIGENQELRIQDAIGSYCRAKMRAEIFALGLGKAGAPVLVVNPTLPVGPGDEKISPPTRMILGFCNKKRREYIHGDLNLADVRDIAEAMVLALNAGVPGRRYVLSGENLTVLEVFQLLARLTGLPPPNRRIPFPIALAFAFFSEIWADWVSGVSPEANLTGVLLTRRIMHFDSQVTLRKMGWKPRPVLESLRDALSWHLARGEITLPGGRIN